MLSRLKVDSKMVSKRKEIIKVLYESYKRESWITYNSLARNIEKYFKNKAMFDMTLSRMCKERTIVKRYTLEERRNREDNVFGEQQYRLSDRIFKKIEEGRIRL